MVKRDHRIRPDPVDANKVSLTNSAISGSFWISTQWFLNKLVTAGATLLIAFFLSPEDYGVAATAFAVATIVWVFLPESMGDVLVAYPRRLQLLAPTAQRLAFRIAVISGSVTLLSIPAALWIYDTYPPVWLGCLLAVLAIRPFCMAMSVVPLSNLRQKLEFRRIALIDGFLQFAATLLSVGCAAVGGRGASLVVPQILNEAARAVCYVRVGSIRSTQRFHRRFGRRLMRVYFKGAGAQYVHNVLVMTEVVILGYVAGEYQTGLFGFAFLLAAQANVVIVGRIGIVLQSIFGELQQHPVRQVEGFLRTQRVLGAVCVPVALLQVVLAEPFFDLILASKWQPAVPVFQALSLLQAFYFASGPSMACLKSQRRFHVLFLWQSIQMLLSFPAFWFGAKQGGAVGVAIASMLMWSISIPTGTWLCTKVDGRGHLRQTVSVFLRSWIVGLPVFALGYVLVQWLDGWGTIGNVVAITVAAPALFIIVLWITWFTDREFQSVADHVWQMGWRAIGRVTVR